MLKYAICKFLTLTWDVVLQNIFTLFLSFYFYLVSFYRSKILLRRKTAWIIVFTLGLILGIGNIHVFFMYELYSPSNSTDTYCAVVSSEYHFAASILIPWIDITVFTIIPSTLIISGNTVIIYNLVKAGLRRTDMTQTNSSAKQSYYKILPMLLLVSTFFVTTTIPICVYFVGKPFILSNMKTMQVSK